MSYILDSVSLKDISAEIVLEVDSTLNQNVVLYWLQHNVPILNNRLYTTFQIDPATLDANDNVKTIYTDNSDFPNSMTPTKMSEKVKVIFKMFYLLYYYDVQSRSFLGAAGTSVTSVNSDGASVKLISKLDISKGYQSIRKDLVIDLERMIHAYNMGESTALSISGDDDIAQYYAYISAVNRVRGYSSSL